MAHLHENRYEGRVEGSTKKNSTVSTEAQERDQINRVFEEHAYPPRVGESDKELLRCQTAEVLTQAPNRIHALGKGELQKTDAQKDVRLPWWQTCILFRFGSKDIWEKMKISTEALGDQINHMFEEHACPSRVGDSGKEPLRRRLTAEFQTQDSNGIHALGEREQEEADALSQRQSMNCRKLHFVFKHSPKYKRISGQKQHWIDAQRISESLRQACGAWLACCT